MNNDKVLSFTYKSLALGTLLLAALFAHRSYASPSIEDYALLPKLHSIAVSPGGKHYALIQRQDGSDVFIVVNAETRKMVGGSNLGEWKGRQVLFAGDDYLIIRAAKRDSQAGPETNYERGVAFAYNISSGKIKPY